MNDCLSREAAIEALNLQIRQCDNALANFGISMKDEYAVKVERASLVAFKQQLESLPSIQPARKRGKWKLLDGGKGQCSECQSVFNDVWDYDKSDSFCRGCGADMREGATMAQLVKTIQVTYSEYRPCYVDSDKRALFHRWETRSDVCGSSPMVGGHCAGQISFVQGIVELEDGTVRQVSPGRIQFVDSDEKFCGVAWPDKADHEGTT